MRQRHLTWILFLGVLSAVVLGVFVLLAVGVLRPKLALSRPFEAATPEPEAIDIALSVTPSPTPAASPTPPPTAPPFPQDAVNLLVNGTPLFALSDRASVEQLLNEYLATCAYEELTSYEHLIRAYIDAELSVSTADTSVPYLTYREALDRLLNNRTLIPVVRSVERAEISVGSIETTVTVLEPLPEGTRLIRSLGKAEHLFGLSETLYKNGIAVSASQTLAKTRVGSDPASYVVENGAYAFASEGDPGPDEGERGKPAGDLKFRAPCRGRIVSNFGIREGRMHYGLDYALKVGDPILAPEAGTVIFCGERGDYGLVIEIRHGNGFVSRLTHCASPTVELEQHVTRGEAIAVLAASEENDVVPHLHYELLIDDIPYNPQRYIR